MSSQASSLTSQNRCHALHPSHASHPYGLSTPPQAAKPTRAENRELDEVSQTAPAPIAALARRVWEHTGENNRQQVSSVCIDTQDPEQDASDTAAFLRAQHIAAFAQGSHLVVNSMVQLRRFLKSFGFTETFLGAQSSRFEQAGVTPARNTEAMPPEPLPPAPPPSTPAVPVHALQPPAQLVPGLSPPPLLPTPSPGPAADTTYEPPMLYLAANRAPLTSEQASRALSAYAALSQQTPSSGPSSSQGSLALQSLDVSSATTSMPPSMASSFRPIAASSTQATEQSTPTIASAGTDPLASDLAKEILDAPILDRAEQPAPQQDFFSEWMSELTRSISQPEFLPQTQPISLENSAMLHRRKIAKSRARIAGLNLALEQNQRHAETAFGRYCQLREEVDQWLLKDASESAPTT